MKRYRDLAADGGSNIVGQIVAQRTKIQQRLAKIKHIIAIGSGKGGVGKSTLVMQIASTLNKLGHSVGVLDADMNGPSQVRLGGISDEVLVPNEGGLSLPRTANGIRVLSLATFFKAGEVVDFESVAQGESYTWRATKEFSLLSELLAGADWEDSEILLIDLPPGAERTVQFAEFFGPKAAMVLVTIPSALAREVVQRSLVALKRLPNRFLGIIENMQGFYCKQCKTVQELFPSIVALPLEGTILGAVPFDSELAALCDQGSSITDRMDLVSFREVHAISVRLLDILEGGINEVSMCAM